MAPKKVAPKNKKKQIFMLILRRLREGESDFLLMDHSTPPPRGKAKIARIANVKRRVAANEFLLLL